MYGYKNSPENFMSGEFKVKCNFLASFTKWSIFFLLKNLMKILVIINFVCWDQNLYFQFIPIHGLPPTLPFPSSLPFLPTAYLSLLFPSFFLSWSLFIPWDSLPTGPSQASGEPPPSVSRVVKDPHTWLSIRMDFEYVLIRHETSAHSLKQHFWGTS